MDREGIYSSPARQREQENRLLFRTIRVPAAQDNFFQPLERHVHRNHSMYFRLLVVVIACMWSQRNVANLYRYLDAEHHRTRCNQFFLGQAVGYRGGPPPEGPGIAARPPSRQGNTIYLIIDEPRKPNGAR